MISITPSAPSTAGAYSRMSGFGAYRPNRIITNAEICTHIDSSDEWIRERSGIIERRWAEPQETVVDMAVAAAQKALSDAGVFGSALGAVIVATVTHRHATPSAASMIADHLGTKAPAFDVSAACAGFSYGVSLADSLIRTSPIDHVLVIGVEKLSDYTDLADRGTAFLFGDGAGAVIISRSDEPGIGPTIWGSDGSKAETIISRPDAIEVLTNPLSTAPAGIAVTMEGQAVFRWAVYEMAKVAAEALAAAGITADDLDVFVPHQANNRITDTMIKTLGLPASVVVARDITMQGNTSAASIPLALDRLREEGTLVSGGTALFIGFGAGLVYAAQVVRLP
jgi:3-oxoacyl-[acyl-carrier-protein] synthase III